MNYLEDNQSEISHSFLVNDAEQGGASPAKKEKVWGRPSACFVVTTFVLLLVLLILAAVGWSRKAEEKTHSIVSYGASYTIGQPPELPSDGDYIRFNLFHLNDVYELLPLREGRAGGLARVSTALQMVKKENPNTLSLLAGDLISPSAISYAKVDGKPLEGKQMIAAMNAMGLDLATFGNHEFDFHFNVTEERVKESKFKWISSNVLTKENKTFPGAFGHEIRRFHQEHGNEKSPHVDVLFFGLTIDSNLGPEKKVNILPREDLAQLVDDLLRPLHEQNKFDLCVGLTHLDIRTDAQLVEDVPLIDLILGGHEHGDFFVQRGERHTPIYKADANAFSVWIHRLAFNLRAERPEKGHQERAKRLFIHSTLTRISPLFEADPDVGSVADFWWEKGMAGFEAEGFQPKEEVCRLPLGVFLDGRDWEVRSRPTDLTRAICNASLQASKDKQTTIALFNSGSIRLDDVLSGEIVQYDILRTLPFNNKIVAAKVPGKVLAETLTSGQLLRDTGMFPAFHGVFLSKTGEWLVENTEENLATSNKTFSVATSDFLLEVPPKEGGLKADGVVVEETGQLYAKALIKHLHERFGN